MMNTTLGMSRTYNSSSLPQKAAVQSSTEFIQAGIDVLDVASVNIIADFGSSHGANSLDAMKAIIDYLRQSKKIAEEEPLVVHNDLPTNDWSIVFKLLLEDNSYKGVASGRSFYEQCLPKNSVAIAYSSTSIQWLSKKPCYIRDRFHINYIKSSKENEAFAHQARLDYSKFLQHRSAELVSGGVLIFSTLGADDQGKIGFERILELLYECAQLLPLTTQELLDYTFPIYCRQHKECLDENLFTQHAFQLIKSKILSNESPLFQQWRDEEITFDEYVHSTTSFVRGWSESILEQTLMNNGRKQEDIPMLLDKFWALFEEKLREQPEIGNFSLQHNYVLLKKN